MPIEIGEIFYPENRAEWRSWLLENHLSKQEIWVKRYLIATGKPSLTYDELVEECLCFGWIDGVVKKTEPESRVQRITPRREKGSFLSELNRQRIWKLKKEGKIVDGALDKLYGKLGDPKKMLEFPTWTNTYRKNKAGFQEKFNEFPHFYRRLKIGWISECGTSPRRMPDAMKRLEYLVKMTLKGKCYGTEPLNGYTVADFQKKKKSTENH